MNQIEREEMHQDILAYIAAGGTIKVYSEGTGKTKDGTAYGDGPIAKLLYESTDGTFPWK